jgi:hypothetical protein
MNTFSKKSLCVAIAATGLLGAGGVAQAVNLSEEGTGNVLIYPYYTVRTTAAGNAYNTYINITNTTASTKAVKVRFREGKNSREVLDFNVFLSPFDMWTASVVPTADGAGVATQDSSCTIPSFTAGVVVPFRNLKYSGSNADTGGDSLDRTREGYVEVLEMATYATGTKIHAGALHHQTTGKPLDCSLVTDANAAAEASGVLGGVAGTLQLINPGAGASASWPAVALDNFYPAIPGFSIYRDTGSPNPDMTDSGTTSAVKSGTTLTVSTGWAPGSADAVSAVLMHNAIMNEYILDNSTLSKTDWVITMPTKNAYVSVGSGSARAPFQSNFSAGKSCDDVAMLLWDREERFYQAQGAGPDFSPKPPGVTNIPTLCAEANVITFNNSNTLASANQAFSVSTKMSDLSTTDFAQNGWMRMSFVGANAKLVNANTTKVSLATGVASAAAPATYAGLPVVGFNVFTYTNSALKVGTTVANVPTNYGMGVVHKSTTSIQ